MLISFAFSFKCYSILMILILFPLHRPLCVAGRLGERKRKRAGHDGKGKKRNLFPLPIVPLALAIFIGIASGSLCGGESPLSGFLSLLFVQVVHAIIIIIIIIGRLQSRRLRASSSHNDPVPIQTACPGQSCCLCLPKGVECI